MRETISIGGLEVRFLESKESTRGSLDMFEMTVQPNAKMPVPHYHESWEETIYGLAGTTTFTVDGREVALGPGDTLFIPRGVTHGFRNAGDTPSTALCFLTPGVLGPEYFREIAALLSAPPPDPVALKETMLRYGLVPVPPT